jgi:putative ABC transport system ATP-binding protein
LKIENVKKLLDKKPVLNGINLDIKKGEIISLVGPSGSGKSTLLRCLNRLIELDEGSIIFDKKDFKLFQPAEIRRSLILVQQESVMFEGSVIDNIGFGPRLIGNNDIKHLIKCMKDAGLSDDFANKNAEKLSGGEKKRVALARALALKPSVLLLDEPTAGVDPKNMSKVENTIVNFSKNLGLTVVWVTHDVSQAKRVSNRIANLKDGKVIQVSKTEDFKWEGAY